MLGVARNLCSIVKSFQKLCIGCPLFFAWRGESNIIANKLTNFCLSSWDKLLYSVPHVVNSNCLHASAVRAGLHFSEEEAGLTGWMSPDGDVPGIVRWIWAVFLGAGGTKDGNDWYIHCRGKVHGAAIIADEERALFELGRQLSYAGFACEVDDSFLLRAQTVF